MPVYSSSWGRSCAVRSFAAPASLERPRGVMIRTGARFIPACPASTAPKVNLQLRRARADGLRQRDSKELRAARNDACIERSLLHPKDSRLDDQVLPVEPKE